MRQIKKFRVHRFKRSRFFKLSINVKMFKILTFLNKFNYNLIIFLFLFIVMRNDHRMRQTQSNIFNFTFIEFSAIETFKKMFETN